MAFLNLRSNRKDVSDVVMLTPLCNISISMDLRVMTITEAGKPASEHCLASYLLETKDITNPLPPLKVGGPAAAEPRYHRTTVVCSLDGAVVSLPVIICLGVRSGLSSPSGISKPGTFI